MSGIQLRSGLGLSVVAAVALCTAAAIGADRSRSTAGTAGGLASKDGQKGKQEVKVEGILTAVAADGTSITIQTKNGKMVVVPIDMATEIEHNEMSITVADLALLIGDFTEAKIAKATGVATKVEVGE